MTAEGCPRTRSWVLRSRWIRRVLRIIRGSDIEPMQRFMLSLFAVVLVLSATGFTAGFFTGETRKEESCVLCRAVRYTGVRYGFSYERVENTSLTDWYRQAIDPQHGQDSAHPHLWRESACAASQKSRPDTLGFDCGRTAPIFLLRPEIEKAVIEQIKDKTQQIKLIEALNTNDRKLSADRVHTLIEYFYIDRDKVAWPEWWAKHAAEFGLSPAQ